MEATITNAPSIITTRRIVRNLQPVIEPSASRIAIIGEAPGEDEENYGYPFVGRSGGFLTNILKDVGIDRNQCLVGNVCQVRPPGNRISAFSWHGEEIQSGLAQLRDDIRTFNPNLCVLLGATPLRAARNTTDKITEWRGSLFCSSQLDSPFFRRKCLASLHPAYVLREFSGFPLLKFDLLRAANEGKSAELVLPERELITSYDASTLIYLMDTWPKGLRCSVDIEGGLSGWPCVSLCARPTKSITIAWGKFTEAEHCDVLRSFARLMGRRDVPKVLQNSLYDNFVLSFGYGLPIRNVFDDTMLKGWEVYCELPKGLGTQTSIWTREPFYKTDRKSDDIETFYRYCAKDSAVTLEICNNQDNVLTGPSLIHYRKNIEMLNPLLYMELRGIKYDQENVSRELHKAHCEIKQVGEQLCQEAGNELRGAKGSLSSDKLKYCLYQLDPGYTPKGRRKTLYEWKNKKYPPQYKRTDEGGKVLTTDIEALLHLRRKQSDDEFLNRIIRHRHLESLIETLNIGCDPDGRVRCGYNIVGTETGRLTCYTSPTGSGANLTTITESCRNNYIADDGYDFFQCDLKGADGWTVAARCHQLGDSTMLEDLQFGLQIAKIIVLLYDLGLEINLLDRDSLLNLCRTVLKSDWRYFACKRVQHGTNYDMGIPTLCTQVMKDSFKKSGTPIYIDHREGSAFQQAYLSRYLGISRVKQWAESVVRAEGKHLSASGQTRIFFGRRFGNNIHDTIKEFLAHEPQSNTTWATNLAMLNLWNDPENRRSNGSLIIEPLHQVHDALCGQWPQSVRAWARHKVKTYFNNPLTIAGTTLIIPFEGRFGRSWGELENEI